MRGTVINVNMVETERVEMITIILVEGVILKKETLILDRMEGSVQIKFLHLQTNENEKINRVANPERHLIMTVTNLM